MTEKDWFDKYYTPENKRIIDMFTLIKFGELRIEVHNKKPVVMYPSNKIRLQKEKLDDTNFTAIQTLSKEW